MRSCQSVQNRMINKHSYTVHFAAAKESPYVLRTATNVIAVITSTRKYDIPIRFLQCRHRPFRSRKLSTGTLSYQATAAAHDGQKDRGRTIDRSRGTR